MASFGTQFGTHQFGVRPFGFGRDDDFPFPLDPTRYSLEVWSSSRNTKLANLPDWTQGRWVEKVNNPATLEFSYPWDGYQRDILLPDPVVPLTIKLWESQNLRGCFLIDTYEKNRDSDGLATVDVSCGDLMQQLAKEHVDLYETAEGVPKTVFEIMGDLFAYQDNSKFTDLYIGTIDNAIGDTPIEIRFEKRTILSAIQEIQKTVGGYLEVTPSGRLNWRRSPGVKTGIQIRWNKNMPSVKERIDMRAIKTQVIALGRGIDDDTKLKSTKTRNTATYGTITEYMSSPTIHKQDELDKAAQAFVNLTAVPKRSKAADVIDLSKIDTDLDYEHEWLLKGASVVVVDDVLNISHYTSIYEVSRDLAAPARVNVTLTDPDAGTTAWSGDIGAPGGRVTPELETVYSQIADLIEALEALKNEDIGILDSIIDHLQNNTELINNIEAIVENWVNNNTVGSATIVNDTLANVNARLSLDPSHEDYYARFTQGMNAFTYGDGADYVWVGNDSDAGTPGDWQLNTGVVHNVNLHGAAPSIPSSTQAGRIIYDLGQFYAQQPGAAYNIPFLDWTEAP